MLIGRLDYNKPGVLPDAITADEFAETVLGFEEVDEAEQEEGEG